MRASATVYDVFADVLLEKCVIVCGEGMFVIMKEIKKLAHFVSEFSFSFLIYFLRVARMCSAGSGWRPRRSRSCRKGRGAWAQALQAG